LSNQINLTSGRLLAHNTMINLVGNIAPTAAAFLTIPYIVQRLGTSRFGLLSLVWMIIGYFGLLDFGLGAAAAKYVAEALGSGDEEPVPRLVWTAVTIQVVLGVVGAALLFCITPLLTERVLKIEPPLASDAETIFRLVALSIPIVLVSGSFRGVLSAVQRFDLINAVSIPSRLMSYLLPVVALIFGWSIVGIAALLVTSRCIAAIAYCALSLQRFPALMERPRFHISELKSLASFGGWVTVGNTIAPALAHLDRFIIGAVLGMSGLSYYTAPFEIISRLWLIPGSLVDTVFPAFSTLAKGRRENLQQLYAKVLKFLVLVSCAVALVSILFCHQFLSFWLGDNFAHHCALVAQLLLIGSSAALVAPIPGALLGACGRPDLLPKLYVVEAPINALMVWFLVRRFGLTGAGISFALRAFFETAALLVISMQVTEISWKYLISAGAGHSAVFVVALALTLLAVSHLAQPLQIVLAALAILIFFAYAWARVLDARDRDGIRSAIASFLVLRTD
jgi:O-antigen/teichoic acid export membrane protein